eukprot:4473389-Pyramimonas_sp.AAC.1
MQRPLQDPSVQQPAHLLLSLARGVIERGVVPPLTPVRRRLRTEQHRRTAFRHPLHPLQVLAFQIRLPSSPVYSHPRHEVSVLINLEGRLPLGVSHTLLKRLNLRRDSEAQQFPHPIFATRSDKILAHTTDPSHHQLQPFFPTASSAQTSPAPLTQPLTLDNAPPQMRFQLLCSVPLRQQPSASPDPAPQLIPPFHFLQHPQDTRPVCLLQPPTTVRTMRPRRPLHLGPALPLRCWILHLHLALFPRPLAVIH